MGRDFLTFIGVDLGGGKGKNTAVARLQAAGDGVTVCEVGTTTPDGRAWHDEALVAHLGPLGPRAVMAVDAPLTVTACMRCRLPSCPGTEACVDPTLKWFRDDGARLIASPPGNGTNGSSRSLPGSAGKRAANGKPGITPYTQRAAEVLLHQRHGIVPRETLGQGMGPLTARAAYLTRALRTHGFALHENLIEVYPKATIHKLFGEDVARSYKRKVGTYEKRARILEELRGTLGFAETSRFARQRTLEIDHCFDAVMCAYTAFLWAKEGWTLPAAHREVFEVDGWIYGPGLSE